MTSRALFFLLTCLVSCSLTLPIDDEDKPKSTVAAITDDVLPLVTKQYNAELPHYKQWSERCMRHWDLFVQASSLSGYPPALIAGFAMHESGGCRMEARDRAGGRGFMQITSKPSRSYRERVAQMLDIQAGDVRYTSDPLHNVLMGTVFLADYESRLHSRSHGILAYNMGVGGVQKTARRMGYTNSLPSVPTMAPHLAYNRRMKPRVYVWKVLASVVMMDKSSRREDLLPANKDFTPEDIPGWDPNDDPWRNDDR